MKSVLSGKGSSAVQEDCKVGRRDCVVVEGEVVS